MKPDSVAPASFMETESKRLWQQTIMGCNILIDMLGNYVTIGVPGVPVSQLKRLTVKLQKIVEEIRHADSSSAK